jgi:preprotein translocase subunit Sec61beta
VLSVVVILGAGLLSWFDHQRSIRPSSLLAVYLLFASLLDVAKLRTLWSIPGAVGVATAFSLVLSLKIVALLLESISKYQSLRSPDEYDGVGSEPFSGLWTRIGYVWVMVTVRQGYRRVLSVDDLPAIEPQLRSRVLHCHLEGEWVTCKPCPLFSAGSNADI